MVEGEGGEDRWVEFGGHDYVFAYMGLDTCIFGVGSSSKAVEMGEGNA